jgi:hypothetical protein
MLVLCIEPLLLQNTPPVISVGLLILKGWIFLWTLTLGALLFGPRDRIIRCTIENNVPFIDDEDMSQLLAAEDSSEHIPVYSSAVQELIGRVAPASTKTQAMPLVLALAVVLALALWARRRARRRARTWLLSSPGGGPRWPGARCC